MLAKIMCLPENNNKTNTSNISGQLIAHYVLKKLSTHYDNIFLTFGENSL
jgi:hypothetical protein